MWLLPKHKVIPIGWMHVVINPILNHLKMEGQYGVLLKLKAGSDCPNLKVDYGISQWIKLLKTDYTHDIKYEI